MHNYHVHLKCRACTLSQTNPSFLAHGEAGSSTDRQKEAQEHRYSGELHAKIAKYTIENGMGIRQKYTGIDLAIVKLQTNVLSADSATVLSLWNCLV